MNSFSHRNLRYVLSDLAVGLVIVLGLAFAALVRTGSLAGQLQDTEQALTEARADLAALQKDFNQVQGGVAIFTAQVTAFQEQLAALAPSVAAGIDDAFATSTLEFQVPIDEEIPINTVIEFDRMITVPIQTSIPIDETVETTITVDGPFGVDIPLNVSVPIKLDLPIDLEVAFPINERIPVSTNIPVSLNIPIRVDVAGSELATLVSSLRAGLTSMSAILEGLS